MTVARETPTFIYRNSLDLTGFIDGTGNPEPDDQYDRGDRPRRPAGGGRLVLHRPALGPRPRLLQRPVARRTRRTRSAAPRPTPTKLATQVPTSHLSHVELREGKTADDSTPKRGEMVRRSTPYAFHDGTIGLYFMGFCREQAPMRERMEAIYGNNGHERDALTDYSTPASGSFYFAPSVRDVGRRAFPEMTDLPTWQDQLRALDPVVDELLAIWRPDGPTEAEVQDMNKLALSILACGYLCHVYTDARRPVFMPLWNYACNQGGPNPDYVYLNAQIDDDGVYEITGFRGTTRFVEITQQQQAMMGMDVFTRPQGDTAPRKGPTTHDLDELDDRRRRLVPGGPQRPSGPMAIPAIGGRWTRA